MRSFGDLLLELGFNPDAPIETQKAFFKHLLKAGDANKQNLISPSLVSVKAKKEPLQLEFNLSETAGPKKVS